MMEARNLLEMLENVELIAMTLAKDGTVTFCNDFLLQTTGWTREEVIGADWFTRFIPDSHPEMKQVFFDTIEGGVIPSHYESPIRTRQGELRVIHWNNTILRDATGNLIGTASIGEDVTERKQAEAALRESEEKFRQLAENITEVFWITDPTKNRVLYVSPAYETIWGQTSQNMPQSPRSWLDAIHPDDRQRIADAMLTKQLQGDYDEEYRIVRPDKSVRWIRDRAFPVKDAAGVTYRIAGVAEDITNRKKLEEQVRQAHKMEAIGQLAGGIAHDFNNILGAIIGYVELARLEIGDNPAAADSLANVTKASKRAADLVRQILTFSSQHEQERKPTRLKPVIQEALTLLRASVPAMIEFQTDLADTPTVLADTSAIHQVIMNLGTNAWHAMRDQPGKVKVELAAMVVDNVFASTHPDLQPGYYVRLSVSDTGCGMDRATMERIFDPFFTTKAPGEGTGLGLPVVAGIVKSHDGGIFVYSQPGEGTTFQLFLPVYQAEAINLDSEATPIPLGNGQRILLVDDEESLVSVGKKILERLGYLVTAKTNVLEALALFRNGPAPFDLVITDFAMPILDGTRFVSELLQVQPRLPIILTTGYSGTLTSEAVRELGARELLIKPATIRTLAEAVHRLLNPTQPA